jgi:hypothetical protein
MQDRYYWGDVLAELRSALIRAEADIQKKLSAQSPGVQAGIWIEQMTSMSTDNSGAPTPDYGAPQYRGAPQMSNPSSNASNQTNQPGTITLVCRAVSLSSVDPSANTEIAYAVENELKAVSYFDPNATQLTGQISPDDPSGTFTFGVSVVLKNPLNF